MATGTVHAGHVVKCGNLKRQPNEYEVEQILDVRTLDGNEEFLIKWKGHDESGNTWEPISNLNCPRMIRHFFIQRSLNEKVTVNVQIESDGPYGFERGLAPSYISMVTRQNGELYFLIKWKTRTELDVVPATQANVRCPQLVIAFYESILFFR